MSPTATAFPRRLGAPCARGSSGRRRPASSSSAVPDARARGGSSRSWCTRRLLRVEYAGSRSRSWTISTSTESGTDETGSQLVLVCGHGTRDPCCALRGTAVYGALASSLGPEQVWISSHQGGHRFAANVLVLPSGVQLGRISVAEAPHVVAEALAGRIELDHFRGRATYPPEVQAADIAVRRAFGLEGIDDLQLVEADGSTVRFRDVTGREHVAIAERRSGPVVPASCGADPEPQVAFSARVV